MFWQHCRHLENRQPPNSKEGLRYTCHMKVANFLKMVSHLFPLRGSDNKIVVFSLRLIKLVLEV